MTCKTCSFSAIPIHEIPCSQCHLGGDPEGKLRYLSKDGTEKNLPDPAPASNPHPVSSSAAGGDAVNHPSHYNREGSMECIEEMVLLFGVEETKSFCKLNAWKYRYRAADKNGTEDLKKSDWYLRKYAELSGEFRCPVCGCNRTTDVIGPDGKKVGEACAHCRISTGGTGTQK